MDNHTWADVAHLVVQFAWAHPWRFFLTIPLGCGFLLLVLVVAHKIFFTGPVGKAIDEFKKRLESVGSEEDK